MSFLSMMSRSKRQMIGVEMIRKSSLGLSMARKYIRITAHSTFLLEKLRHMLLHHGNRELQTLVYH